MPRRSTRVPSYRHHKASGQAVVTLAGKDIYLGPYGSDHSRQRYDAVVAEWLANQKQAPASSRTGALPAHQALTIDGLFVAYWRYCQTYYVGPDGHLTSEPVNIRIALRPLVELFGATMAGEMRASILRAVRDQMIASDLARKTVNDRINRIRRMFKWGVANDLVDPSVLLSLQALEPLRRGRGGAREGVRVKPVPESWIDATIPHLPPIVQAMVRVQQYTGMRPGELVILRKFDLDTTGTVWVYRPSSHKTDHLGHERVIYLGAKAQGYLSPYLDVDPEAFIFSPRRAMEQRWANRPTHRHQPSDVPRTCRKLRDRYTPGAYLRAICYACDEAFPPADPLARRVDAEGRRESIRARHQRLTKQQLAALRKWQKDHRWHPHQLRHNAATYLRKQFGVEAARVVLGHRSAAVTEIYAEMDQTKAAEIMGRVG